MKKTKIGLIIVFIAVVSIFGYKHWDKNRIVNSGGEMAKHGKEIKETQLDEVYSPDKKYKAITYLDGGGATASDDILITLVPANVKKVYTSYIVFHERISLRRVFSAEWKNNKNLVIGYKYLSERKDEDKLRRDMKSLNIYTLRFKYDDIDISYKI